MLTDAQLEVAARFLCKMREQDPNEMIGHGRPGSMAWYQSPRWRLAFEELRAQDLIQEALRHGGYFSKDS